MKNIILILLLVAAVLPFQNCTTETPPAATDTTKKPVVEPINTFKFNGVTTYNLKWDSFSMSGYYKTAENVTKIEAGGYSAGKYASFVLTIPGKAIGTFKRSTHPSVNIEVSTGIGTTEKNYVFSTQPNKEMTVTITKIDPIGGRITGGFAGDLQVVGSIETATISAGSYDVKRSPDD